MKVCPLTRISSSTPEICPNVLLTGDVFYVERVYLYRHCPTEHTVILVGSIRQVFEGFVISLECESLASCSTGSCSMYSLSSEKASFFVSFHCTCSDFPFLMRSDSGAEILMKAGMWSL